MNRKTFIVFLGIAGAFFVGMFSNDFKSYLVKGYYYDEYTALVFKCDHAMREHFISKQKVTIEPNSKNVNSLLQAEIALIDCQDYDLVRKRLLSLGLEESDLSELELRAIEEKAVDIRKAVEIHEIRYD